MFYISNLTLLVWEVRSLLGPLVRIVVVYVKNEHEDKHGFGWHWQNIDAAPHIP